MATTSWCCRCEGGCVKEREPGSYLCQTCQDEGCEPHRSDPMTDLELSIERARAASEYGSYSEDENADS